jgi:4-hydroxybenzoyl-CoA thioesterase
MQFNYHQPVLFKHCDPAGIVFYPRYFEMINDAIEAFFDAINYSFVTLHKTAAVPTAQIEVKFLAPSRHGDQLFFTISVATLGTSSLVLAITASANSEERLRCLSTLVHVDTDGKSTPWLAQTRAAITPYIRSTL